MLSEKQIDELVQPILDKQERISIEVLRRFGQKIKEIKEADTTNSASLIKIRAVETEARQLDYDIDELLQEQLEEILLILMLVAEDSYFDSKYLYDYAGVPFLQFDKNTGIRTAVDKTIEEIQNIFQKLFNTPGFIIRDLTNPGVLKPTKLQDAYKSVVGEAVQHIQNNPLGFDVSMRKTEREIINSGLNGMYVDPESGRIFAQRLDVAVRNNLLDGISMVQQCVQDAAGLQFNADGKELSAHMFSAPDHEPFQGHQFTNENWDRLQSSQDFEDINGQQFMGVARIIGVWNCRHIAWSILVGYSKPRYTQRELNLMIQQNQKGVTLRDGTHLTMYECTQRQRRYEARIRQAREGLFLTSFTGDKMLQDRYNALIANRIADYEAFSNFCGLPTQMHRTEIVTK